MKRVFPLEQIDHNQNKKQKYWNKDDEEKNIEAIKLAGDKSIDDNQNSFDTNIFKYTATNVSTMNPVEDFNSMISSINIQLYKTALEGMNKVIEVFLNEGGSLYDKKSKECIECFRKGCITVYYNL